MSKQLTWYAEKERGEAKTKRPQKERGEERRGGTTSATWGEKK